MPLWGCFAYALDHHAKAQMLDERVKITVTVQEIVSVFNAERGDYGVDGLANGYA